MFYFRHRINTVEDLKTVSEDMGIELDLRYDGDQIILQHDPFAKGVLFENFLKNYRHAGMILNIKSEGIEEAVLNLVQKYAVKNYFFLDVTFPALIKLHRKGVTDLAVRFSEHEPIEQCLALKNIVNWVWVDCFNHCPLNSENTKRLKEHFKICLVSPELQNHPLEKIDTFKQQLSGLHIDAVCTKRPDLWQK